VVGQPRLRGDRQGTGEQHIAVHCGHSSADQRVAGAVQSGRQDVPLRPEWSCGPVPGEPERLGGQVDPACPGAVEDGGPVDRDTAHVQRAQRHEQRFVVVGRAAQGGHAHGGVARPVEALPGERGEHRVRPDLQEGRRVLARQGRDAVGEPDGQPRVPDPVAGIGDLLGGERLAGDVADHGQPGWPELQAFDHVRELGEHGVHQR
jgi:hypothetical protein